MDRATKILFGLAAAASAFWLGSVAADAPVSISEQTEECIACHSDVTPGIVQDWLSSRHARTTPQMALAKPLLERRMSAENVDQGLQKLWWLDAMNATA